ncbi:MAG TPA: hypothetical protein VF392_16040 [Terracidiphilus sp.]
MGAEEAARTAEGLVQLAERLDAQTRMFKTGDACEEEPRRPRLAA